MRKRMTQYEIHFTYQNLDVMISPLFGEYNDAFNQAPQIKFGDDTWIVNWKLSDVYNHLLIEHFAKRFKAEFYVQNDITN